MSGEPSGPDPQSLWQNQATEYDPMTLAQIHEKADAFQSRIRRRNLTEYIACVVVVAAFAPLLFLRQSWMMQAGALAIMAATIPIAWQLHRRGSAQPVPEGGSALIASYRQELTRQRDALRSIGVWYLAPFAPGMGLLLLGRWFQSHAAGRPIGIDHLIIILSTVIIALVFLVIWLVNQRGADRLQKRIDEL
jgi:hypothetical protein